MEPGGWPRRKSLQDELRRVIRLAARSSWDLQGKLPVLSSFALVQAAGELSPEAQVHVVLHQLIPRYAKQLPESPEGMAIRELLRWRDEDGSAQSLQTRYHKAAAVLDVQPTDFGRRREPSLLAECAAHFLTMDLDEKVSTATSADEPDRTGVGDYAPALGPSDPAVGIVNVYQHLDLYRLTEDLRGARDITILNTWIPALDIFVPALIEALANGALIRILMVHPDSPAATMRSAGLRIAHTRFHGEEVRLGVAHCLEVFGSIAADLDDVGRSRLQVRLYDSLPSLAVYSIDARALASVFLHGQLSNSGPQLEVHGRGSLLGNAVFDEVETMWDIARPIADLRHWRAEIDATGPMSGV